MAASTTEYDHDVVRVDDDDDPAGSDNTDQRAEINLKNVTYDLKLKGQKVRLLHGITCKFDRQFVAIMGASGAGKVRRHTSNTATFEFESRFPELHRPFHR